MEEHVFFDQQNVKVTNARFIVHGQTYAMNGITSVKQMIQGPNRLGPLVIAVGAFGALLASKILWALLLFGLVAFWWTRQKSQWSVVLNSTSGETTALNSNDREFISTVVGALNDAIVHRG